MTLVPCPIHCFQVSAVMFSKIHWPIGPLKGGEAILFPGRPVRWQMNAPLAFRRSAAASTSAASFGGSRPTERSSSAMALRGIRSPFFAATS